MKTAIFDFDGTLADSFEALVTTFEEVTGRKQKLTASEIKNLRGQPLKSILRYLKIKKWQIPRLLLRGRKALGFKIIDIKPFPGTETMLKKIKQNGYQMFIVSTNSSANISLFLKAYNLDGYFETVYGDIGLRKSAALKKLLARENLSAQECVYVGDEVRDIEAGHKAGLLVISVGWGFNYPTALQAGGPNKLAMSPAELLDALKTI